jgi:hypothetical protein
MDQERINRILEDAKEARKQMDLLANLLMGFSILCGITSVGIVGFLLNL